ncbi:MAG TPA: hypothetical protein VK837_14545 [Longimicrobiales bacterium]|nr:hypothetical protein [Longimicrobiales bacterium]
MRRVRPRCLLPVLAVALFAGCGDDDDPTGPDSQVTVDDFVGSWTASSFVFTNNADTGQQVDIIALGGEFRATVLEGGRVRNFLTTPDAVEDEWDAQLSVNGNTLTSTPAEATRSTDVWTFQFQNSNTVILTDTDEMFDFTLMGGAEVPATLVITLVRN